MKKNNLKDKNALTNNEKKRLNENVDGVVNGMKKARV